MQRILTILILLVSFQAQAQTQIIYGDPDVTDEDKIKIDAMLREYTGPAPSYFKQNPDAIDAPEFALLFSDQPFAETKFIRAKLSADFPQYQLQVQTIPTTLWDTTMAKLWLTEKDWHERITTIFKKTDTEKNELRAKLYFDIYAMIGAMISEKGRKNSALKEMIIDNLRAIKENHFKDSMQQWPTSLINEYEKIQSGTNSMLIELVDEEYTAARNNKLLIIRATKGAKVADLKNTEKIIKRYDHAIGLAEKNGVVQNTHPYHAFYMADAEKVRTSKAKELERINNSWHLTETDMGRVLDFPESGDNCYGEIHKIEQKLKAKDSSVLGKQSKELSYATSLLGGFMFDSFDEITSASTFVFYATGKTDIVYTLMLDKKWRLTEGKSMFHFDRLYPDAIISKGEEFHPRLRSIFSSLATKDEYKKLVTHYKIATDATDNYDKDMYGTYNANFAEPEYNRDIKIRLNYVLKVAEILTHARVIAIGKDTLKIPDESPEAQKLVSNQKLVFETFKAHMLAGD